MLNRALVAILLVVNLLVGAGDALAAPPVEGDLPEVITLDRALALLREQSPRSQAELAEIEVAAAEQKAARVYPNPSLSYGGQALVAGGPLDPALEHQIVLEQPLLLGHRRARQEVAELGVSAERARVSASLAVRALAVRQAFTALLARQERVRVLEQSIAELARLEEIVRKRHAVGDRSEYDVTRVELESTALQIELRNAETDVQDAAGELAALLGFPGWQPRAEGSLEVRELPTEIDQLWATAERQRPSIEAARAQQSFTRGGLTLARRERLPIPALAFGAAFTQQVSSTSLFFGVSMPLPVFDRGQGNIARASAEIAASELALEAELAESRAELERAQLVYTRHRETLATIEQQMVARIPALQQMAEDSYRGGTVGILELLDSFESVKEIRLTHLDQREALKLAEAELVAAAGIDPLAPAR